MAVGSFKLPIATSGDWTRPSDWLAMPTGITSANQTFVGLHAIFESGQNYCAFLFTTSAGQYQVDWGDGTTTLHNSNTIAQRDYNYSTYDTGNTTLSSRGYKQAIITVTAVSGNLLTCDFQRRFVTSPVQNQAYLTGFLDCILSMPNGSSGASIIFGGSTVVHRLIERFDIKTIGNVTNMNGMFQSCSRLQKLPLFDTSNVTTMSNTFEFCSSLQSIPLFNTINVTSFISCFLGCGLSSIPLLNLQNALNCTNMFQSSGIREIPLLNTSNVTNMSSMFALSAIRKVPLLNTSNVTNMNGMFNTSGITQVPLLNTSNVTNMGNMFQTCRNLKSIPALSTTSITTTLGANFSSFAINGNSLTRCEIVFARQVEFNNCQLSQTAIVEIFNNLVDRTLTTSANINISGNWGASALTAGERLIATAKNWTITG